MKNDKKQNKTEKGKPFYCEPVISREGKIGRLTVDDPALGGKSKGKKALVRQEKKDGAVVPSRVGRMEEVTISDSEFFRSSVKKTKNKRGVHTIKSKDRNPFPVVTVLACVVCTILFMSLVFNLVRINEYTKDISDMRGEVSDLTRQKSELSAVLEKKNNSEELAKYLSESVKSVSRRTPNQWIDNYVVIELRVMLKNSTKSIKQITEEMNFPNQSFLGKYFKEHVGMSPSEFRRS